MPERHTPGARTITGGMLLLVGVALAAANMRPAVTSLAAILGEVRGALGVGTTWASVITSMPTLCFGVAGVAAPLLARRWGVHRAVAVALGVLTAAMLFRVVDGPWTVLAGTLLTCGAIALCNVLIPVVVKESFPDRVGTATALYTTAMAGGGALGSTFTPMLLSSSGSWRLALATWSVVALAALVVWTTATRGISNHDAAAPTATTPSRVLRSPLAWTVTAYFALQSLVAYVVMGWLPEVFKGAGLEAGQAGLLLGLLLLVGVPMNMVLPPLVAKSRSQSGWAIGFAVFSTTGVLGLIFAPTAAPVLWALLIGVGLSAFPLALVFLSLRTANAADTAQLSAMAQGIGYIVATAGPFLFGSLHVFTGAWTASLLLVLGVVLVQGCIGVVAGRPRTI